MNGLRVNKIIKGIKFERVLGELKANNIFQGESLTGYFRLALVFIWGGTLQGSFDFQALRGFFLVLAGFSFRLRGAGHCALIL